MRNLWRTVALASAIIVPFAAEALAQEVVATAASEPAALLIPLKVSGRTEGESELKAGAGIAFGLTDDWDLSIIGSLRVETVGGLATLLDVEDGSGNAGASWSTSWSASFASVKARSSETYDNSPGGYELEKGIAYRVCLPACRLADQGDSKEFCTARGARLKERRLSWAKRATQFLAGDLVCDAKIPELNQAKTRRDDDIAKCAGNSQCTQSAATRYADARAQILVSCAEACAPTAPPSSFCKIDGIPTEPPPEDFSPEEFCPAGREFWRNARELRHRTLRIVPFDVDFGVRLGTQKFTFREDNDGVLTEERKNTASVAIGTSFHYLFDTSAQWKPILQGLAILDSQWTKSPKVIEWCSPAGEVPRSEAAGAPTDSAEVCSKAALSAPTKKQKLDLKLYAGLFDNQGGRFRTAIGPEVVIPLHGGELEVGAGLPIVVNLTQIAQPLEYSGLIAITPRIRWTIGDEREFIAQLEIGLLGQRSLFSEEFDEL